MTHVHHAIDDVELATSDVAALERFDGAAFGWEFNDYAPDYAGIRAPGGDGEVGGLNGMATPLGSAPGAPFVLLLSDDLDASVSAVVAAGGRVVEAPSEFPGGGRFHFADPSGNLLGVWAER